ncbi:MAG TPA: murein peptide amidase A [Comamonadaceae bacterium]|nr:murein peptide amidase A [Comamonadaceae bacterium]
MGWARVAALCALGSLQSAGATTTLVHPLPGPRPGGAACELFLHRLPGVGPALCQSAQLVPSGSRSQKGLPLYWRDVLPPSLPQEGVGLAAPLRVLVVGAMHGDELTSASLALHWIALAQKAGQPVHWRFIPVLNPDGLLARRPTRVNARGVDLNRNFDTPGWEHDAPRHWEKRTRKDPRRWPGTAPLSEPESQFLHAQMDEFRPQLVVSIHAPYGVLDFDGPHEPPQRLGRLRLDRVGVFPGSLGHYGGVLQGMPVVTIELDHALRMPRDAEVRSMWDDLLRWMDARLLRPDSGAPGQARK